MISIRSSTPLILALALQLVRPTASKAEVIERVVAVVNDDAVFLSELRRRAAPIIPSLLQDTPADRRQTEIARVYDKLLEQLIDESLIEQTANELQITVTTLEVDQALNNVQRQNNMTEDEFWTAVQAQGLTRQGYRTDIRKQLLRLKVINQKVRSRVRVNEDEVRNTYEDQVRTARRTQRFRAAHVFFPVPPNASATLVAEVNRTATQARTGLNVDNFDAQATTLSGGDLGWLDQGDLPESLENTLLDLEPGEISQPVRGPAGFHVFLLKERSQQAAGMPTYEESRAQIEQQLMAKAMQRQEAIFLDQLRRSAVIQKRR